MVSEVRVNIEYAANTSGLARGNIDSLLSTLSDSACLDIFVGKARTRNPAAASAGCAVTLSVYFRAERRGDVPFRHDPIVIPGGATRTVNLLGESFGLEKAFAGGARIPTLIAIVTTDDRLHTKTTLHPVVIKGTSKRG